MIPNKKEGKGAGKRGGIEGKVRKEKDRGESKDDSKILNIMTK